MDGKFPAAKVGIIAGIAAAFTLLAVAGLIWFSVTTYNDMKVQAHLRAEMSVSQDFKGKLANYLDAVKKEHAAAAQSWAAFETQKEAVTNAFDMMQMGAGDSAEMDYRSRASLQQDLYDQCVEYAIKPGEQHTETLQHCEDESPMDKLASIISEAQSR